MNKYEQKLNFLRNKWVREIMTIKELDSLSEDKSQWDSCYTYKNFLEEGCRAFCNYVFPVDDEADDENSEFKYFYDKDSDTDICDENRDTVRGIWAAFDVLDDYDTGTRWEDLADIKINIKDFEIV
jgi:hypothetical protein